MRHEALSLRQYNTNFLYPAVCRRLGQWQHRKFPHSSTTWVTNDGGSPVVRKFYQLSLWMKCCSARHPNLFDSTISFYYFKILANSIGNFCVLLKLATLVRKSVQCNHYQNALQIQQPKFVTTRTNLPGLVSSSDLVFRVSTSVNWIEWPPPTVWKTSPCQSHQTWIILNRNRRRAS